MKKQLNLKARITRIIERLRSFKIDLGSVLLDLLLLSIIMTLLFNLFLAFREGVENMGRLEIEEEKLVKLQEENKRLLGEESYYQSIEFRKAYARDSLNLTKEGETLYMVVRNEDKGTSEEIVKLFDQKVFSPLELWKLLIFST